MHQAKGHIARFAALALIFNALLPFFAVYDAPSQATASTTSSPFGDKLLICSGDGFKWIKRADAGKQEHNTPSHFKCALCYLAAHGLKDATLPVGATLAQTHADRALAIARGDTSAAHSVTLAFASRAPPAFSFI